MTISNLISIAARVGWIYDESTFGKGRGYTFVGTLDDGYSASRLTFNTIADAVRYFTREENI